MGLVHPDRHDIFVSYAHIDNQPFPDQEAGWVQTLVEYLQNLLDRRLGRREKYALWIDPRLTGNEPFTPEILDALRGSAVLLMVLSRAYLASTWCVRELEAYRQATAGLPRSGSRIFLVEVDRLPGARPAGLDRIPGYPFWFEDRLKGTTHTLGLPRPDPDDDRYYRRLDDLSRDIAEELGRLKAAPPTPTVGATAEGQPPGPSPAPAATVFLAEVTDDLDEQRDEVRRYLAQAGYEVLPRAYYPREPAAFRAAAEADLGRSILFVQLLSALPGRRLADDAPGAVALQHACAVERKVPVMQWRSRDIDLEAAAARNPLLAGPDCLALGLEEFKGLVAKKLAALVAPEEPAPPPSQARKRVFVNAEKADRDLAKAVGQVLARFGALIDLPQSGESSAEIRKDLIRKLRGCDALVLIYGQTKPSWVSEQLRQSILKYAPMRKAPLRAALYKAPPTPKPELDLIVPADFPLQEIDAPAVPDEGLLRAFFASL